MSIFAGTAFGHETAGAANLAHRLLALDPAEASFAKRGFAIEDRAQARHLEQIGGAFIEGYNAALRAQAIADLRAAVERVAPPLRGFAVEGAAMAAVLRDGLSLRRRHFAAVLAEFRREFDYLVHVGAGWALARMPWRGRAAAALLDPVHHWLAQDGSGFHDGYFFPRRILDGWKRVRSGYAARGYDQGVGRALWFVCGGSVTAGARAIRSLPAERAGDLWSGLGLAMAYAGQASPGDIDAALALAGAERGWLRQGVAFAAEARVRGGHVPDHTEDAALRATGLTGQVLSVIVQQSRGRLETELADIPPYEVWRRDVMRLVGGGA